MVLMACQKTEPIDKPAYVAPIYDLAPSQFMALLDSLAPLTIPTGKEVKGPWQISFQDSSGLDSEIPVMYDSAVELPHRILLPDAAIWYQQDVTLGHGVLMIDADDGAQLWLDGERVPHSYANYFPTNESTQTISIRVLNNAMKGGLRKVVWFAASERETNLAQKKKRDSTWLVLRKVELLDIPDQQVSELKHLMLSNSKEFLENQPIQMKDPVFLTAPMWQQDSEYLYVRWVSDQGGRATISWGKDSLVSDHEIETSSESGIYLVPFPTDLGNIYYQIDQNGIKSPIYQFTQPNSEVFRFGVWADSQGGWDVFQKHMKHYLLHEPEFTIGAGDLVAHGYLNQEYLNLLQSLSIVQRPHYLVPGNHDYDGYYENLHPENYFKYLGLPQQDQYFSWNVKNCAFIALDVDMQFPTGISGKQKDWFLEQVETVEWKNAEWRFIVLHHPPYAQGWEGYHGELSVRSLLDTLYETSQIDMVLAGHCHDYERLVKQFGNQTTAFVVLGGGGGGIEPSRNSDTPKMDTVIKKHHYAMVEVEDKKLTLKVYDLDNQLMDSVQLIHQ